MLIRAARIVGHLQDPTVELAACRGSQAVAAGSGDTIFSRSLPDLPCQRVQRGMRTYLLGVVLTGAISPPVVEVLEICGSRDPLRGNYS
jgi:hypothetical protein